MLHPTKIGGKVKATVTFTKIEKGVQVQADINGLTPGKHGFHIHEFGDARSPDGMSAGGHFNPDKTSTAARDAAKRHVGDLGNIDGRRDGHRHARHRRPAIGFSGPTSILGRGRGRPREGRRLQPSPSATPAAARRRRHRRRQGRLTDGSKRPTPDVRDREPGLIPAIGRAGRSLDPLSLPGT